MLPRYIAISGPQYPDYGACRCRLDDLEIVVRPTRPYWAAAWTRLYPRLAYDAPPHRLIHYICISNRNQNRWPGPEAILGRLLPPRPQLMHQGRAASVHSAALIRQGRCTIAPDASDRRPDLVGPGLPGLSYAGPGWRTQEFSTQSAGTANMPPDYGNAGLRSPGATRG